VRLRKIFQHKIAISRKCVNIVSNFYRLFIPGYRLQVQCFVMCNLLNKITRMQTF